MVNRVTLIGNLGQDPEVKFLPSGQAVCSMRIATSRSWTDKQSGQRKEETEWHSVETYGKQAEACGEFLAKGRQVYIEGRIKTDSWEKDGQKRYKVKIVADTVRFLGSKGADKHTAEQQERTGSEQENTTLAQSDENVPL